MSDRTPVTIGSERGIALITTLLVMMLMSALLIGFTSAVMSDQRFRYIDRDRVRAFYAAQAGLEKLSADLATLFFENVAPNATEISDLSDGVPSIHGVQFTNEDGIAYGVTIVPDEEGDDEDWGQISTGPYEGLIALKQTYELDAAVRTSGRGEAHLRRRVETVAIPVFQFGIFSDVDLSFHAGPNFNFGGRVHTNGNLFLAQGDGTTLTLPQKVTAVKEIVRGYLMNGVDVNTSDHQGVVRMARGPNTYRDHLAESEGSVQGALNSSKNEPAWTNLSLSAYNGYIRNGRTGARTLNLPVVTLGGHNVDIVKRPLANEDVDDPSLLGERFYSKVSLRILLSDRAADLTALPGATAGAPVELDGDWTDAAQRPAGYNAVDVAHPPIALANANDAASRVATTVANANLTRLDVPALAMTLFRPELRYNGNAVTCTTKTIGAGSTTLSGCSVAMVLGGTITTADGHRNGSATISEINGAGTVYTTTPNTIAIKPFWAGNQLVSCAAWTPTRFNNCSGITAAVAAGTVLSSQSLSAAGTGLIGGFIKIEMQGSDDVWHDVTMEILNHGFSGPNLAGGICADPTPNAIIRLQHLRDNGGVANTALGCNYALTTSPRDHWPNVLFDQREALQRGNTNLGATNLPLGGVMHYVTLDVANLSEWLSGTGVYEGQSGTNAKSVNGYSVYFSDRRNNRNLVSEETGEYGFEDIVNPSSMTGAPNNTLDAGEDANGSATLETYGQFPSYKGTLNTLPPGAGDNTPMAPLFDSAGDIRPTTNILPAQARVNRAYLFRRALKLQNGALGQIIAPGLTIVAENPVYVLGDWNANASGALGDPHVATAIITDAVTLLSSAWNDVNSFTSPYTSAGRPRAANSYYRFAVIAGKNAQFPRPSANDVKDFGSDGGAHNFLRMLEGNGGSTVNYRGSIATFYYSRQAVGNYKSGPYVPPTRNFNFDTDFLNPSLLPPLTPVFRDVNARGFTQEIRPGR